MIERAYIHVAGPKGAGKTTLIEGIFRAFDGETIAVRCDRDDRLDGMRESKGARDPDVRRYRAAGATCAARVRFPGTDVEAGAFFESDVMCDYSQAVVVEGDCPLGYVDLEVFVAPLLPPGAALLRRGRRPRAMAKTLEEPFVGAGDGAGASLREVLRKALAVYDASARAKGTPRARWEIAPTHRGLERAGLVVINVRESDDRDAAGRMLEEIGRIRSDDEVRMSVLGRFGHKIKITAVAADLSDPKDTGTRKALARIKRAIHARVR